MKKNNSAPQPPQKLQQFQDDYGRYLRDPKKQPRPTAIPQRRSQVYEELLFNNLCSFIDKCFPVARSMVPAQKWRRLCRMFFRDWRCSDPIFSQIPFEFVQYINQAANTPPLPAWFAELLHYEWTELEVDMDPADDNPFAQSLTTEHNPIATNGTLRVLSYQWPVHKIRPAYRPRKPQQFCTLVFRNLQLQVKFIEVNAITAYLVQFFQQTQDNHSTSIRLAQLAQQLQWPNTEEFVAFSYALIQDLTAQGVFFEAIKNND